VRLLGAVLAAAGVLTAVNGVLSVPSASAGQTWSAPTSIDSNLLTSVSCGSSTDCVAVDDAGNSLVYNGSTWSSPHRIDILNSVSATSVSCTSTGFCAAVDSQGNAYTGNGSSWSLGLGLLDFGNDLNSVSCTSSSFCSAVDSSGYALTYDGLLWGRQPVDSADDLAGVSCTSPSFCAAVSEEGDAFTYNGTTWSAADGIDPSNALVSVSCTSTTFCAAVDQSGNAFTYNGTHWSSATDVDPHYPQLNSVSCTSSTFCVATDAYGDALVFDGSQWTPFDYVEDNSLDAVSCASPSFCVAVDDAGQAVTYNGMNAATVTDVEFSGSPTAPVVTVSGSGFGTQADLGIPNSPGCGPQTGSDFGNELWVQDWTDNWVAGRGTACIGLLVSSYSDTQIIFSFGSDYSSYTLSSGADFTLSLLGSSFNGTVSYSNTTVVTGCSPGTTSCTATVSAPSQSVAVSGAKLTSSTASITLTVANENFGCQDVAPSVSVATLEDTGLASGSDVTVTDTVAGLPNKKGISICYQPVTPTAPPPILLKKCHGKTFVGACYKSITEVSGSIVATMLMPVGDPRYHVGGGTPMVTSIHPTAPKPGKKLTIKGADLSEVTAVTIGGVPVTILKTSPNSVSVTVPAGVQGAVVVSSLAGVAQAPTVVSGASAPAHGRTSQRNR
jgi:hypothetical protein